ncbi:lipid droplet assembly factor 1 isoform X2 [Amia ocellicauda]
MWRSEGISLPREMQQLQSRFTSMMSSLNSNSKVAAFMSTTLGQYLDGHPFFALALLVFGAMAAVPIGLFLTFAIVSFVTAAFGFICLEGFLLSLGAVTLLCVLGGLAIVAFVVSAVLTAFYITTYSALNYYYSQRSSRMKQDPIGSPSGPETIPSPQEQKGK